MDAAAAGAVWTPRPLNDLKISSIYNRSATEAPAEVSLKCSNNPFDRLWFLVCTMFDYLFLQILL
jgi:hypothetical protein